MKNGGVTNSLECGIILATEFSPYSGVNTLGVITSLGTLSKITHVLVSFNSKLKVGGLVLVTTIYITNF